MAGHNASRRHTAPSQYETIEAIMPPFNRTHRTPVGPFMAQRAHQRSAVTRAPETTAALAFRIITAAIGATAIVAGLALAIAALYVAKSALGIDLFAGPSPLHDTLYLLAR